LCAEGIARTDRAWDDLDELLPEREAVAQAVDSEHPYAHDLAVQGRASLRRLFGPITTEPGRRTLLGWLLEPASPSVATARAEAARELSDMLEDRLTLSAHGRHAPAADPQALERFLAWAEAEAWTLKTSWLRAVALILPAMLIAAVVGDALFGAPPLWILPGLGQLWVLRSVSPRLRSDFKDVQAMDPALAAYVPQLEQLAGWPLSAPELHTQAERIRTHGGAAFQQLARVAKLVDIVHSRGNLVYLALAPMLLLDFHLGVRLDHWRRSNGAVARGWIEALGEIEALSGLGSLAHDHPEWVFPTWQESGSAMGINASGIGHPLLGDDECIRNDVEVGPPGSFLLVTGSNMSGKSTLLRAIGTNCVLAGVGAPVCAAKLELPRVRIFTSMSIEDSLSQGISLFMAQLLRVRSIVETARAQRAEEGPVLYLLDEMLHGTNSAERQVAARAVLRHLLAQVAIGVVSTHDLALADAPDLAEVSTRVHFRETVHREEGTTRLEFDYLMRPGLAQTSNALALLEAVGLDSLVEETNHTK
jgi:predicted ATPase